MRDLASSTTRRWNTRSSFAPSCRRARG
jgi:hypothetical protein